MAEPISDADIIANIAKFASALPLTDCCSDPECDCDTCPDGECDCCPHTDPVGLRGGDDLR